MATEYGNAAMQTRDGARIGPGNPQATSEDCLTLNISAPAERAKEPRPVMVFIHGGGYVFGTSALRLYSGARLALRGDVVVVTLNYRLGGFGYVDFGEFSTPTRKFDSNLGLRDQVAALEWVRRNIAAFGGDPGNVTIFGESAGAHAVVSLLATPSAAGLFHRAIAQSAPADWAVSADEARTFARRCVERLGATPEQAAEVLTAAPANDIRKASDRALGEVLAAQPGSYPIAPQVDGDFLPLAPLEAIRTGKAHAVPLIIGTNHNEAALFKKWDKSLPTTESQLHLALGRCGDQDVEKRVVAAYPGYPGKAAAVHMGGDFVFWRPTIAVAEGHSRYAPTYMYRFDFAPRAVHLAGFGPTHALELIPVFGGVDSLIGRGLGVVGGYRGFLSVQREFQDNWLAFARDGQPRQDWPQYSEERRSTRIIDATSRVEVDPDRSKRLAWDGVRVPEMV